ncbi:MAG TPA: sulfite dehydrogenase [Xanthobacteraceae bacterium]|jgi:sulfane dehydrogenase subunit SoxC|nr:sulfite dehydrogenase [Xanthobacteraceae bacterium]
MSHSRKTGSSIQQVAGNGLLDRRALLGRGVLLAGAMGAGAAGSLTAAAAEPLVEQPWSLHPGNPVPPYQTPSHYEDKVVRTVDNQNQAPGGQRARTPHQLLRGIITPNGLHFTIMHAGIPDIDPAQHKLVIHGMVRQPLEFTLEGLMRYQMVSRIGFTECGGNSAPLFSNTPIQANLQALHGLSSCADWTGVPLATLLDEAGVDPKAKWIIAEGADSAHITRSVPLKKVMDDALVALYQNGERIQPGQGYPMRLWLPGYEGNMNVKYLRRVQVTDQPGMTYYESKIYTDPLPDGKDTQFYFVNEVKSFITSPSPGLDILKEPGVYEITGIAYSGSGRIEKVMVSADGGKSWAEAALMEPRLPKAFTRFSLPWRWDGGPAVLQSRAWDESGAVQPTREQFVAARGQTTKPPNVGGFPGHHANPITSWGVDAKGEVKHVYA